MPNWKFHNTWSKKYGISSTVSTKVNMREDMPYFDADSYKSVRLRQIKESMSDTPPTYDEIKSMGEEYLNAWFIHLIIDEMEDNCEYIHANSEEFHNEKDLIQCAIDLTFSSPFIRFVPDGIISFLHENARTIIEEMPVTNFHLTRSFLEAYHAKWDS